METVDEVITELQKSGSSSNAAGMKKFAITGKIILGVKVPEIRRISKLAGRNHRLAIELWNTEIHEARILATMIEDPEYLDQNQIDRWVSDVDSWDLCDHLCGNLLIEFDGVEDLPGNFMHNRGEFVRRAGFVLIAEIAVRKKDLPDSGFAGYLEMIEKHSSDGRNFVKKAASWALRQIGKRNLNLNRAALEIAEKLRKSGDSAKRWIGSDAYRELASEAVKKRLLKKEGS